ncbi:hypothetical protein AAE478_008503 [Parahypoxylon ruwenzoriense]
MPTRRRHQPIGFVCCHCRYRSSGSFCSNPDRPDCPHRGVPRCQDCPILFTPPASSQSNYDYHSGRTSETSMATVAPGSRQDECERRRYSVDSGNSSMSENTENSGGQV